MELNATLGVYTPSFFSIKLNFGHHMADISAIPELLKPTFYHEYFHFIQDVTIPFGYHFAWGNMSRVRQAVSYFQTKPDKHSLPIPEPERTEIINQINLFRALNGDVELTIGAEDQDINLDELVLASFSLELRPELTPFEEEPQTRFIRLTLRNDNGKTFYYWLGAVAIVEAMTVLIQEKHFGPANFPRFPYRIVQDFISFIRPEIEERKDIMFVLCDLALQTNHPGYYLNYILVNSSLRDAIPDDALDVYRIGFDFYREHNYNVAETFQHYKDRLQANTNDLFGHQAFRRELEWFNTVIENGFQLRNQFGAFMLDLYNAEDPILNALPEVIQRLGTPDIVNYNYDRVFALPAGLRGQEEAIHPVLMTALYQFYKDLINAQPRCGMVELCRTHAEIPVNEKCYHNQWEKLDEAHACPLMAFYRAFGLEEKLCFEP